MPFDVFAAVAGFAPFVPFGAFAVFAAFVAFVDVCGPYCFCKEATNVKEHQNAQKSQKS